LFAKAVFLLSLFTIGGKCTPRELNGDGTLVGDFIILVTEKCDRGRVGGHVTLAEVNVIVVGLTANWDDLLSLVVDEGQFFVVFAGFCGLEVEDKLFYLTYFEDAF